MAEQTNGTRRALIFVPLSALLFGLAIGGAKWMFMAGSRLTTTESAIAALQDKISEVCAQGTVKSRANELELVGVQGSVERLNEKVTDLSEDIKAQTTAQQEILDEIRKMNRGGP